MSTATRTPPSSIPCADAGPSTATVCLTYDPAHPGDVIARTDANGQTARYAYDAAGNLVSTSDPRGNTTTYQYDLIGRKTAMVRPLGNVPGANPISYTSTMTYNAFGETTAITDALGDVTTYQYDLNQNLITTTDALGRQTINGYDADNERTSVTRPDGGIASTGYDSAGNVMTTTDALARSTTYDYDALNRPISMTDPLGRTTLTGYDLAGHVITSTDVLGHSTIYGYDAANERTSITRADGGVSRTGYDLDGQVITTTDALGNPTHYSYDSLHRRVGVTDPLQRTTMTGYDLAGNVITTTDPLRRDVVTTYDAAHRPVLVTRPDGSQTHTEYDADGNVTATVDPLGHTTRYGYDALDRRVTMTDALGHTTVYRYDAVGNHTATIDPLLHTTTIAYDTLDRVITTTDPLSHTTIDGYDLSGNLITATDALSHTTVYGYDAANQRTSATQPDGSALGTGHDADGNVITQTDALGRQTSYGYNAMNQVVAMTNPLTETTAYTYDLDGNRTALMDPMGRTTRYGYDADNEPITVTYSDALTPDVQFTYDKSGQRQSMTDGTGTTSYSYDLLDQPMTVTNGAGQTLGYRYDLSGNLTHLIYPDSSVITRTYDAANHWTALTDPVGHTFQFSYDPGNRLTSEVYPTTAPLTSTIGDDGADRVTSITDQQPGGLNWTFGYSRDDNGQVSGSRDPVSGASHRYSYSPLNQLVADQQTTGAVTTTLGYSPDSADQITGTINGATNATSGETYDLAGELTGMRVTGPSPATSTYGYNVDGDRTSVASNDGNSSSYGYDQADRLISATVGMTRASYIYDGDGLRQSKTVTTTQGVSTTPETWDTVEGLPLLLQDGMATYVIGPDGLPLEAISGTTVQYLLHDQLGSTRGVLNSGGSLVGSQTYDPYGNLKGRSGTTSVPFGFAGQLTDAETGFQYLRARYYDPATAQFLTRDPLEGLTQQPYAYTADDPLNTLDPTGLCTNFDPLCWGGQAAGEAWNITSGVGQFGWHVGRRLYRSSPANAWTNPNDYNYVWRQNTTVAGVVWDKSAEYARGWVSDPGGQAGRTAGAVGGTARDYGMSIACKVWSGDEGGAFVDIFTAELSADSAVGFSGFRLLRGTRAGSATNAQFGWTSSTDYRGTFSQANPNLDGQVVVHHAVEQQVLTRYPGIVAQEQIHSLENLRGIPNGINNTLHLSEIRRAWNEFYRAHPSATQQELLDQATLIDDQYGHLFNPPIR